MRHISKSVKDSLLNEPEVCNRSKDGGCAGRLTWEHTLIYGGRQIDEAWSIIKLCARHHEVDEFQDNGDLQKDKNVWIALNKATDEELLKYSKVISYIKMRERLNEKYGVYTRPTSKS